MCEEGNIISDIPRLDHVPSYEEFLNDYLKANRPCILPAALVAHWPARRWADVGEQSSTAGFSDEPTGELSRAFDVLASKFGDYTTPVVLSGTGAADKEEEKAYGHEEREEMKLEEAVKLLRSGGASYVKDFHLVQQLEQRGAKREEVYTTPCIFADDWTNNIEIGEDDFRFCYAGVKGSGTSLHRDDTSYSWSTNIIGRKRWRFFPPQVISGLRRFPQVVTSQTASSVSQLDGAAALGQLGPVRDGKMGYEDWQWARKYCIEIEQEDGETIFVPSNWYHEVLNLEHCISLNHNWINSNNLLSVFHSLCGAIEATKEALVDVRDLLQSADQTNRTVSWKKAWYEQVIGVVEMDQGWAWPGFWRMIRRALEHPPAESHLRPPDAEVHAIVANCLNLFASREETSFLASQVIEDAAYCARFAGQTFAINN
ncbi:Clavaminate synthase-like protein [Ceraceosorus guamensis]|uniref:Clavaminate synthase-like protein n=1 Tax=Ceraceosorus guamensis TaxID=1522189 RepID=A0A316W869_9BASI|nr:Clavaminate synthase-like protein [Ceraceosorus guamensis]PWN46116.1 Clavaminate synthase-like protein [Ceraceosorus guamensis]